jgi:hypothetical protein
MFEALAKTAESGIAKESIEKSGEISPQKTPSEIFKTPEPDLVPPWKSEPKIPEIAEVPEPGSMPPWKSDVPVTMNLATRNESLEGREHPETGVPFERKTIEKENGETDEGVFPVFDSAFDAQLPEDLYKATDKQQFDECNKQLKEAVEKDPELAKKFTPEQLEQIKNGDTPDGYTWHHNEEKGKMQLVDFETHAKTGHTGGRVIWGGGQENR